MMPRHARVHQPQVAVGTPAEQGNRSGQFIGSLVSAVRGTVNRHATTGHDQPRTVGEAVVRLGQVTYRLTDLATFHGAPRITRKRS